MVERRKKTHLLCTINKYCSLNFYLNSMLLNLTSLMINQQKKIQRLWQIKNKTKNSVFPQGTNHNFSDLFVNYSITIFNPNELVIRCKGLRPSLVLNKKSSSLLSYNALVHYTVTSY